MMVLLKINASSSSRGDVRQARCKTNKAAKFPASSACAVELQEESLKVERKYIHEHLTNRRTCLVPGSRSHLTAYLAARLRCKPLKRLAPRFVIEFKTPCTTPSNKLQYKLQKVNNKLTREPSQPASLPAEVEETKSGNGGDSCDTS